MTYQEQYDVYLARARRALEEACRRYLPAESQVCQAARYSLMGGGKRVRAVLVLSVCEMLGGDGAAAEQFAAAVEMLHCYSLIHDDLPCMDDDDLRRGRPTNHKIYGEAMALLAGDGLLTLAFQQGLSFQGDPAAARDGARLLAEYAGAQGMVGGQCIDLEQEGKEVTLEILAQMDRGKTVALIAAACAMGCTAAGAGEKELQAARQFAFGLGMAFQLRDDVLDVLGDAAKLGKNTGMDSARDKRNYVSLLGVEEAQRLVEQYTKEALDALEAFPGDTTFLREFALSLVERES